MTDQRRPDSRRSFENDSLRETTTAFHRSARRLADAVTEFDVALSNGLSLHDLTTRDHEVQLAEVACLSAALDLMEQTGFSASA